LNLENQGGSCYSDITKNIENNFNFLTAKIRGKFSSQIYLNRLFAKTEVNSASPSINQKDYDFIDVCGCSKYLKASFDSNGLVYKLGKLTNENKRVSFILANMDYMNYIFKTQEESPSFSE